VAYFHQSHGIGTTPECDTTVVYRYFLAQPGNCCCEGMCDGSPVLDELIAQFATDGVAGGPGFAESCHKIFLIRKSRRAEPSDCMVAN